MIKLNSRSRIALVCRGGPENGPFSAAAASVIYESLLRHGLKLSSIYVCSGSVSTALLGCLGEFDELCTVWANLTSRDIIGKTNAASTMFRVVRRRESLFRSDALGEFIKNHWDLDAIFSSVAIPIQIPAVDVLTGELIIFSNKNPKHKEWFLEGVLGSKALVPYLNPTHVINPEEAELIARGRSKFGRLILIDGGYRSNMLLEEAIRDGFDLIFLIDIHGLVPNEETNTKHCSSWPNLLRNSMHILACTNDRRQYQLVDRINEEIALKEILKQLCPRVAQEQREVLEAVIERMDKGRLRLGDKQQAEIVFVSDPERSILFNFIKCDRREVLALMEYGFEAGRKALKEAGLA